MIRSASSRSGSFMACLPHRSRLWGRPQNQLRQGARFPVDRSPNRSALWKASAISITVVALCGCGASHASSSPSQQELKLNAIHVGDSKSEIYRLLGTPEQTDLHCWYFSILGPDRMTQLCFRGSRLASKTTY